MYWQKKKRSAKIRNTEAAHSIWWQTGCVIPKPHRTLTNTFPDTREHLPKTLKNSKGGPWGVKTALPSPVGAEGAPGVLSGISVALQQVKRPRTNTHKQTQYTHTQAIVFQLNGSMLIAFHTEQQPGSFVCTHTHTHTVKKGTQVMPLRESVWHICLICSIGCLHGMLITDFW